MRFARGRGAAAPGEGSASGPRAGAAPPGALPALGAPRPAPLTAASTGGAIPGGRWEGTGGGSAAGRGSRPRYKHGRREEAAAGRGVRPPEKPRQPPGSASGQQLVRGGCNLRAGGARPADTGHPRMAAAGRGMGSRGGSPPRSLRAPKNTAPGRGGHGGEPQRHGRPEGSPQGEPDTGHGQPRCPGPARPGRRRERQVTSHTGGDGGWGVSPPPPPHVPRRPRRFVRRAPRLRPPPRGGPAVSDSPTCPPIFITPTPA